MGNETNHITMTVAEIIDGKLRIRAKPGVKLESVESIYRRIMERDE